MIITPTAMAIVGSALPFTPLAHLLGFQPLPARFFLILIGMVVGYLALVEVTKRWFYRRERNSLVRPLTTHHTRLRHRRRRRAGRFVRHVPAR